jgi:hypothetical protein
MPNYYCEYCGNKQQSISSLTASSCSRHPNGPNKGKHKVYEGSEKSKYSCKYCGNTQASIATLTGHYCSKHPSGPNKGKHSPLL